ncbi:P-loop containing nucleoside triphosphate hydrolase protein, partial [Suillus lakei]
QPSRPNVVLFGERGAGKSSLINMLVGRDVSYASDPSLTAFASKGYAVDVGGREVVVWDSVGLQKGEHHDALSEMNLRGLIQNLHGGLNLLLYCVNAARVSGALEVNYDAFYRIIGGKKVPVVLVVTGLENKDPMEGWWKENEAEFKRHGLTFDGHACITTTRGKPLKDNPGHWHDEQYEQSRLAVKELIK